MHKLSKKHPELKRVHSLTQEEASDLRGALGRGTCDFSIIYIDAKGTESILNMWRKATTIIPDRFLVEADRDEVGI
jgi:hypothetical protein